MIYIVLPAYNEEPNVVVLLSDIARTLGELMPVSEVCVVLVDDGSVDGTAEAARRFAGTLQRKGNIQIHVLSHGRNKGLAEAVKTGLVFCCDRAEGKDVILTMDCDNSHTPGLVPRLARRIFEGYDVIVASRYVAGARVVGLSFPRKVLSAGASLLFRALFPIPGVRDYTCGFRAYRASLLKALFKKYPNTISEQGFSVMIDILLKLYRFDPNVTIGEVPLLLRYDRKVGASKMNVRNTIIQTIGLLLRRRLGNWND